ncbi:hypothetical protein DE146DRAFT_784969 [Phaeosphaeria sp. MPI-PUGE-AT-0046c]|nr:hypothetical protein DE146DRAFT_784969 [Phaeosphaeria sp. MPI-PUGE-AT-0046c]
MASNKAKIADQVDDVLYFYAKKQAQASSNRAARHDLLVEADVASQPSFDAIDELHMLSPPPQPAPPPSQHGRAALAPPPPDAPLPPSIFTNGIEADEYLCNPAFKLHTQVFDDLAAFVDQQVKMFKLRLDIQENRVNLKRLREEVSRCDIEFISSVRNHVATERSLDNSTIMTLFEAAQLARDHYGPAEAEYEPLEVALGAEEYELKDMYSKLDTRFKRFFRLKPGQPSQQSLATTIVYEEPSETSTTSGKDAEEIAEPEI